MNAEISVFVIFAETILYLLLYHLHDCTFKDDAIRRSTNLLEWTERELHSGCLIDQII